MRTASLSLIFLTIVALSIAFAQGAGSTGSVVFVPPAPGHFVATAGSVTCTVTGNAVPATAILVGCQLGAVAVPTYTIPLPANSAYTFDHRLNGDAISVILSVSSTGQISWQAVATPNGGTAGNASGTF